MEIRSISVASRRDYICAIQSTDQCTTKSLSPVTLIWVLLAIYCAVEMLFSLFLLFSTNKGIVHLNLKFNSSNLKITSFSSNW